MSIHGCLRFRHSDLVGIGPDDDEKVKRSLATSSIRLVDGDTGLEIERNFDEVSKSSSIPALQAVVS